MLEWQNLHHNVYWIQGQESWQRPVIGNPVIGNLVDCSAYNIYIKNIILHSHLADL